MSLIVQKYGGTSVANPESLKIVAEKIINAKKEDNQVVVVVSAMGSSTDELISLANELSEEPSPREMDMLLSAGERITMSLLAMHLNSLGYDSFSLTGSQAGIITTSRHGRAEIEKISGERVREGLEKGNIVIVAGFQGFNPDTREITTLGRGGSDATAVALAASLNAARCEIYTDVDGIFTADPRITEKAKLLKEITYDEMLEMASTGAKVLHTRSVELAMKNNLTLQVLSSLTKKTGTFIVNEKELIEKEIVSGVSYSNSEAKVTISGILDKPGISAKIFGLMTENNINVDMIVQSSSINQEVTDITFTIPETDLLIAEKAIKQLQKKIYFNKVNSDKNGVKISVVGNAIKNQT